MKSKIPEIRRLQKLAGEGRCPFCLRLLRPNPLGRKAQACWSFDCRRERDAAYKRAHRKLAQAVTAVGKSVKRLEAVCR